MFTEDISGDFSEDRRYHFTGFYRISGDLRNLRGRLLSSQKFSHVFTLRVFTLKQFSSFSPLKHSGKRHARVRPDVLGILQAAEGIVRTVRKRSPETTVLFLDWEAWHQRGRLQPNGGGRKGYRSNFRKNPHAHKNKIGTSTSPF